MFWKTKLLNQLNKQTWLVYGKYPKYREGEREMDFEVIEVIRNLLHLAVKHMQCANKLEYGNTHTWHEMLDPNP